MIGSQRLVEDLQRLVKDSPADATSVFAEGRTRRVMRFAYEAIHQDLAHESLTVYVKVLLGKRQGVAATNLLDRASLRRSLQAALEIARHAPALPHQPDLPEPARIDDRGDYDAATPALPADRLVDTLVRLLRLAKGAGAQLAGSFVLGDDERAVVTSRGAACYAASTVAGVKLVTISRTCSGYASGVDRAYERLDVEQLLEHALRQCLFRRRPIALPRGTYEVILEPEAVAELVVWLGYITFGAKSFQERTSCLVGRIGEQITGPSITILDDGRDPALLRTPFDCEGVPKQRVALVEAGRAGGIVYDTAYGALYGHPSTGHALPPDETDGPLPMHLQMAPGASSRDEMIRSCRRGLLLPRFHSVSGLLNTRETLMTGLTREGACLIEDGKIAGPIRTLRFTQNLLEALREVVAISEGRQLVADPAQELSCALMPALHLKRFRFTGSSDS
jgi:predicted Zn-dependent protease